jgi:hypothetical protein
MGLMVELPDGRVVNAEKVSTIEWDEDFDVIVNIEGSEPMIVDEGCEDEMMAMAVVQEIAGKINATLIRQYRLQATGSLANPDPRRPEAAK